MKYEYVDFGTRVHAIQPGHSRTICGYSVGSERVLNEATGRQEWRPRQRQQEGRATCGKCRAILLAPHNRELDAQYGKEATYENLPRQRTLAERFWGDD